MDTRTSWSAQGGHADGNTGVARSDEPNRLLRALPPEIQEQLLPDLVSEDLAARRRLWTAGDVIETVYFPRTGVLSLIVELGRGSAVEAGTIGREGMAGVAIALGADSTSVTAICQIPGECLSMAASVFRAHLSRFPSLERLVLRYIQAVLDETSQSVACNARHSLNERCARWLAMTRDRVASESFPLTHEFLAYMLGVRRAGVTEALLALKRLDLIRYTRGRITILDSSGLEKASCQCYRVGRDRMNQLVP